jgi:electron transport complex protein RnfG
LSQQETPGLGARIVEVRPGGEKPWFTSQFEGKSGDELRLKKDGGGIDAITGATISSRAVAGGVYNAAGELFAEAKKAEVKA